MPRDLQELLNHAAELARWFEDYEPAGSDQREAQPLAALRQAVLARADAEQRLADAVAEARAAGHSWASIGAMLGTSGEAARQRYAPATQRTS
jgi:hypothetical protein